MGNRSNSARLRRLPQVADRYLRGWPMSRIADDLGLTIYQVRNDLHALRTRWKRRAEQSAGRLLAKELAKIDFIEAQAWEQWECSTQDSMETVQTTGTESESHTVRVKGQSGDPRYLQIALQCVDKRCRMLGLGEYARENQVDQQPQLIEVVVETPDQAAHFLRFDEYEALKPSEN